MPHAIMLYYAIIVNAESNMSKRYIFSSTCHLQHCILASELPLHFPLSSSSYVTRHWHTDSSLDSCSPGKGMGKGKV